MTTEDANAAIDPLIAAIVADPENDAPRLVWAERVGGERGEFVQVQCALARRDLDRSERRRMRARELALLRRHCGSWSGFERDTYATFVRGFVEGVRIGVPELESALDTLFTRAPLLREIELLELHAHKDLNRFFGPTVEEVWEGIAGRLPAILSALPSGRVKSLIADPTLAEVGDWNEFARVLDRTDAFVDIITAAEGLRQLSSLKLYGTCAERQTVDRLTRLPLLESLEIRHGFGANGYVELLRALPTLRRISVRSFEPDLAGAQLRALTSASEASRLVELDIDLSASSNADAEVLAHSPLHALRRLTIRSGAEALSTRAFTALRDSPYLEGIEALGLHGTVDSAALSPLRDARFASTLRTLELHYCHLEPSAADTLLALPGLERLVVIQRDGLHSRFAELEEAIPDVRG